MRASEFIQFFAFGGLQVVAAAATNNGGDGLAKCPGYKASNVKKTSNGIKADLHLAGPKCNVYGKDLDSLKLDVTVETCECIRVLGLLSRPSPHTND